MSDREKELADRKRKAMMEISPQVLFNKIVTSLQTAHDKDMAFYVMQKIMGDGLLDTRKPTTRLGMFKKEIDDISEMLDEGFEVDRKAVKEFEEVCK